MKLDHYEKKKILILEPHPYHNEILPGFAKYFQDLEYEVDVMVQKKPFSEKAFYNYKNKPKILIYDTSKIRTILSEEKIKDYDFLFLSSLEYSQAEQTKIESFINFLGFIPKTKYGLLGVYHNLNYIEKFNDYNLYEQGRIFSLSEFDYLDSKTIMLNPHYFGNIKIKTKLNKKVTFVFAGHLREYENIINMAENLIDEGYKNFEIKLIGDGKGPLKPKFRHHIKFLGRVNFPKLYKELEKSDFYILHFDPEIEERKVFLSKGTTGSRQLILGFLKPCLINEEFAEAYGFDAENSLIYKNNDLHSAAKRAITMKHEEYEKMQNNLGSLADNIYEKSLNNLKKSIEGIISEK